MNRATRILIFGIALMWVGAFMSVPFPAGPGWGELALLFAFIGLGISIVGIFRND